MAAVAVVGLGAMGSRVAGRLLDRGHDVVVWNRTPARCAPLVDRGAVAAPTPAAAATGADAVVTMVTDAAALHAVTEGPDGVASGVAPPATVVEMSTVGPAAIHRLAGVLPPGVGLLDAPVLGSVAEAESGTLTLFVGGDHGEIERRSALLADLGGPLHVGPSGAGAAAKLVANTSLFGVLAVLGEAVALGDALGLSRDALFDVLAATPLAAQAAKRRPAIDDGTYPARFALALARKDADLAVEAAAGADLRVTRAAASWLAAAADADLADRDYTAMLARIIGQR